MENKPQDPTIEEILAKVRAETKKGDDPAASIGANRRSQWIENIAFVTHPDDGDSLPHDQRTYSVRDFAALDPEEALNSAYRVILGRTIDYEGRSHFLASLREGRFGIARVLWALSRSPEGRSRNISIRWLWPAYILDRLASLPGVGRLARPFMLFQRQTRTDRQLSAFSKRQGALVEEVNIALSTIRKNEVHLHQRLVTSEREAYDAHDYARNIKETALGALSEIRTIRHEIASERVALGQLIDEAKTALPDGPSTMGEVVKDLEDISLDSFYVGFENRFRGSREEISRRSERYLPIFRENDAVARGGAVLDIGCGRGEFLSLLRSNNIATRGIDLNSAMVAEARAQDLDVEEGDAIAYLAAQPAQSLAAITGFHIVEHIPFRSLIRLFDEAKRVLMPGGLVLFETPNPENLVVGACTFHYDPTHIKPIPPDYLRFVAEARGFSKTRVIRTNADCLLDNAESGFEPEGVNDWFSQPADYALYAQTASESGSD